MEWTSPGPEERPATRGNPSERASVPGYGTTSHLSRGQEKEQAVNAAWAEWGPAASPDALARAASGFVLRST